MTIRLDDSASPPDAARPAAVRDPLIVWSALVVFTVLSFALGGEHLIENQTAAAVVVLVIGAVKIRLVGSYFMELRHAPAALRVVFDLYCVVLPGVLAAIYVLL